MAKPVSKHHPAQRFRVGADENGLGPRLGPMIVTAVLAEVTPEGHAFVRRKPRGGLAERLGDSKALVAHGQIALGEAWARAIALRMGIAAPDEDALIHALSADDRATLRAPCPKPLASSRSRAAQLPLFGSSPDPSAAEAMCWSSPSEAFAAEDALVATVAEDLNRLETKGINVRQVRSVIVCTERLNAAVREGKSRFAVDLHAMERLVLGFSAEAREEVHAICGKVGGLGKYSDAFGPLGGRLHVVLAESKSESRYHFPGVGEIAFVVDADASDLLVGLASLVGKYVREALMGRIARYWRARVPEAPDASGYHDPVTAAFVDVTAVARNEAAVPADCFERRSLGARAPTR